MAAVVDLAGVGIVRNGSTLINDINWEVDESDRWVIIGPNGAGKTTLLQVISAQIHPTSGVAGLLGEVLGTVDVFELRPRIGDPDYPNQLEIIDEIGPRRPSRFSRLYSRPGVSLKHSRK